MFLKQPLLKHEFKIKYFPEIIILEQQQFNMGQRRYRA